MTGPIYAIGDIHGQRTMLEDVLARIDRDGGPDAQVVFLGDLTDRGPDSRGVIETILAGRAAGRNWTVIKGNHDRMFTRFMADPMLVETRLPVGMDWLHHRLGGDTTLASYGVHLNEKSRYHAVQDEARAAVPQAHIDFLDGLPLTHRAGSVMFVHAGVLPGVPFKDQTEDDLIWIREPFLSDTRDHGALIVHGHTALEAPAHHGNRVNLDSGAGYGRALTAAVFEDGGVFALTPGGRKPLAP
ncbi:metallophosphoesterase family protein [Anianabacter salinae]|uniref:metallophosphoesterase family protein n=1 Tax=Anianabacter salinae TaxID=2851023 RepID=UPI00225E44EE|nr:metallophosphoesterase family protein [Anianabacter salinae]MBV0913399.1 serine/threonine protein phosphatase [Anianabacter salinae]